MSLKMGMHGTESSNNREQRRDSEEASSLRRRSLQLQAQIAEALGLPVAAFHQAAVLRQGGPDAQPATRDEALAMSRDCSALIEAFTSIADAEERQRLLQIVRAAAGRTAEA